MTDNKNQLSDLPSSLAAPARRALSSINCSSLAAPARRALSSINCSSLEQLSFFTETEINSLHGIGPRAMFDLQEAMAAKNIKFKPG
ncbi:MAG: hypothetical protein WCP19_06825 [Chloroflexota bacterium]